mmetsp:Transcript_21861/g.58953  ORF Transcript_21861/g.58953 Transcript_21861/m.58953 type:complete len:265 (-) Transcript_21861:342-1136(-)
MSKLLLLGLLVALEPGEGVVNGFQGLLLIVGFNLVLDLVVLDGALHLVAVVLESVLRLHALLELLILLLVLLRLSRHLFDVLLGEAALVVGDGDLLLGSCGLLHGGHVEDAVGVNVKGHLDLGHATGHGRNPREVELTELVVVLGAAALALKDLDGHGRLVVGVRGEGLRLLGGHRGVARNEHRHHLARGLNAEGEGGHVEEEELRGLLRASACEDGRLHCRSVSHGLVRVDGTSGLLAVEVVREELLHLGDARGAAHEHHIVH